MSEEKIRSLFETDSGLIPCVILQAAYGGDRRPCHLFLNDWQVNMPNKSTRWFELTMSQWEYLASLTREERVKLLKEINNGSQS
jgi:hypothetical protein